MSEKKVLNGYVVGGYACAFAFSLLVWGVLIFQVAKIDTPFDNMFNASMADASADMPLGDVNTATVVRDSRLRAIRTAG